MSKNLQFFHKLNHFSSVSQSQDLHSDSRRQIRNIRPDDDDNVHSDADDAT